MPHAARWWPKKGTVAPSPSATWSATVPLAPGLLCVDRHQSCLPGPNQATYLVLDEFGGRIGRAWCETDEDTTDRETLIFNLLSGEYKNPVRIVAFNSAQGWCRDVTVDIADELRRRYIEFDEVPEAVLAFLEANERR